MEQNNKVVDVAAGSEFTIIVTENHVNGETEVFGCGHNLKGEIGGGFIRHISDVIKIEGLSNYRIKVIIFNLLIKKFVSFNRRNKVNKM